jgi:hypothetical protein
MYVYIYNILYIGGRRVFVLGAWTGLVCCGNLVYTHTLCACVYLYTHTHTHNIYIYIYMHTYIYICICIIYGVYAYNIINIYYTYIHQ